MRNQIKRLCLNARLYIGALSTFATLAIMHSANAGAPAQTPLFLQAPVRPIMMLNMSKEHQLFFKLYDDYSDITRADGGAPDGVPDLTYNNNYDYYGYFDSKKCYTYDTTNNRFNPVGFMADRYCNANGATGQWSGNFLNWGSMTRIDAIRKILYGGLRSTDLATATVLERAMLPNDAHSFAKFYGGNDISQLTPFIADNTNSDAQKRGITLCNTTEPASRQTFSQNATGTGGYPVIRVAKGNFTLWASNERWQCRWGTGSNYNNVGYSEIPAASSAPKKTTDTSNNALGIGDYVARVAVCVSGLIDTTDNENCENYGSGSKPIGQLQTYGERIHFGLMTGSYARNKSGGVLRKQVGSIANEINADGTFTVPSNGFSIIKTIDLFRIFGYNFNDGTYNDTSANGDKCSWAKSSFNNGECSNWGNPQAEIYLESLRYLAGLGSPVFDADDSSRIAGLNRVATWNDPVDTTASGNYCAPLNILQFNASTTSYDMDNLGSASDLPGSIDSAVNEIGNAEGIAGQAFFIGRNGTGAQDNKNQLCDAKVINTLATVDGICPESPRLEGGYKIAGLAYSARKNGIAANREDVKTFGVALAPAVPKVTIAVPSALGGTTGKTVTIMPACRNLQTNPHTNCAIVDFKIVKQETLNNRVEGKLYVNWEDSEQGGDFDQDMWGVISYSVSSSSVTVTTKVVAQSTGDPMGFGYVISGTEQDGFHVHSGVNNFTFTSSYTGITACTSTDGSRCTCRITGSEGACDNPQSIARSQTFIIGDSTAAFLQSPLYYAAKWGSYEKGDSEPSAAAIAATNPTETYLYATNPRELETSLKKAFADAAGGVAAAATVAANSTRLSGETAVYQAAFDSTEWSGVLRAYAVKPDGTADTANPLWSTDTTLNRSSVRKIYTYDGATTKSLVRLDNNAWVSSVPTLKAALTMAGETNDTNAKMRFDWLLGSAASETGNAAVLRTRTRLLGDIVNSDPAFTGPVSQRYNLLPAEYGSASYLTYVNETKKAARTAVFVGANDGMLHAFDAKTGEEIFAYIPRGVYSKLAGVSNPNYVHQYLVDGPIYVGDVYFDSDNDGVGGEWRTIVVGSLGYGGRGVFALDVTDTLSTASPGTPKVIFDIAAGDASFAYHNDLGYSLGKVLVAPVPGNRWMAIFGNGPNSVNGIPKLIGIDIENPSTSVVVDTKAKFADGSNNNGLSGIAVLPGGSGIASYAYAGDLLGNMWKFNLTDTGLNWSVAYGNSTTPKPLIKVIDSLGNAQPITATPTLGLNTLKETGSGTSASPSVMVYFGTGKYYETTDSAYKAIQSIYGIADTQAVALTTSNRATTLHQKSIGSETATTRTITNDTISKEDWADINGWFLDLKPNSGTATGERVLGKPLLLYDKLILATFIPSSNQCDYGGDGWIMELTGVGDKFIGHTVLGDKGNRLLDNAIIGDLIPISSGEKVHIIGSGLDKGSGDIPPLISIEGNAGKGSRGRMSWRQIK